MSLRGLEAIEMYRNHILHTFVQIVSSKSDKRIVLCHHESVDVASGAPFSGNSAGISNTQTLLPHRQVMPLMILELPW
jgi:hypothetical protein